MFSLLALDLTLDSNGKPWLLEINSHCTLGEASGTMVDVDPEVYTRLVGDVVRLLVLPAIEEHVEQDHGAGRSLSAWPEGEAAVGFEPLTLRRAPPRAPFAQRIQRLPSTNGRPARPNGPRRRLLDHSAARAERFNHHRKRVCRFGSIEGAVV